MSDATREKLSKKSLGRSHSEHSKNKISLAKKEFYKNNPEVAQNSSKAHLKQIGDSITSILDVSSRTTVKILKRLNIGCSLCGWDKASCDVHHIKGRQIEDANAHSNLAYLCPNCHRLVHSGVIGRDALISLETQIGDRWKDYYYGT